MHGFHLRADEPHLCIDVQKEELRYGEKPEQKVVYQQSLRTHQIVITLLPGSEFSTESYKTYIDASMSRSEACSPLL